MVGVMTNSSRRYGELGNEAREGELPIPDELWEDTKSSRDAEEDGVEVHFFQTVVMQQNSGVGVDIGVGVLDFAEFVEDSRGEGIDLRHKFEEFIIWEMFQGEFPSISL